MCRFLGFLIFMAALIGLAGFLGYYFTRSKNEAPIKWPTIEDFRAESQFNATTPEEADRWANTGSGLQLAILNALETKWYSYLNTALDDWQNASKFGMPEVLSLSSSVIPYEKDCWPVDGKVKVCNGDYGVTGWEGINAAIVQDKTIVSSAARMNEYYLSRSTAERKQYTMCHELGHAWGLPHTDESFYNRALGNCLDYTLNPGPDMQPDASNFEFLDALYGSLGASGSSLSSSLEAEDYSSNTTDSTEDSAADSTTDGESDRQVSSMQVPEWVMEIWEGVNSEFSNYDPDSTGTSGGWRRLHEHRHAITHCLDIGQGFEIQVSVLLAESLGE